MSRSAPLVLRERQLSAPPSRSALWACLKDAASCRQGDVTAPVIGDQLLQQALAEEQAKAAKNGLVADPFSGVQFKEVEPCIIS